MNRTEVVQAFLDGCREPMYLEIGIRSGQTFLRVRARRKVAIEPAPRIGSLKRLRWWVRRRSNRSSRIYRMTSDEFFARHTEVLDGRGIDIAFIDGLHTYQQSLRDLENCLKFLKPGGTVLMHDCSPPSVGAATPASSPDEARRLAGEAWDGMWCGDVFKTILHVRSLRPDLEACVLDCDRGIGIIRRGNAREMLKLDGGTIEDLSFADLAAHRRQWLDLRSPVELEELVLSPPWQRSAEI